MGQVVELRSELQSDQVVVFSAVPFWRERGELVGGRRQEFASARESRIAAQAMVNRGYAGALAWGAYGSSGVEWWSRAVEIVRLGETPSDAPFLKDQEHRLGGWSGAPRSRATA